MLDGMSDSSQRSRIENLHSRQVDRQSPTGLIFRYWIAWFSSKVRKGTMSLWNWCASSNVLLYARGSESDNSLVQQLESDSAWNARVHVPVRQRRLVPCDAMRTSALQAVAQRLSVCLSVAFSRSVPHHCSLLNPSSIMNFQGKLRQCAMDVKCSG